MKSGALTSWNPLDHSIPVTGLLYPYLDLAVTIVHAEFVE